MELLSPRDVPLGGLRSMTVRRTLPQRRRTFIGAWCFVDHYGPDDVRTKPTMEVPPHPHTGLQTVSWLFSGEIEHRDSAGHHAMVRPGEVNLMTAGRGISHSEYATDTTTILHGAQLWVALPDESRHTNPSFEHYAPELIGENGWAGHVFVGSTLGDQSPVETFSPLLGAELRIDAGTRLTVPLQPNYEHGLLLDSGQLRVSGKPVSPAELAYLEPGASQIELTAETDVLLLLLGGEPFSEQIIMWWNFIGREHDEVVEYRRQWQALIEGEAQDRFALAQGDPLPPLPAPVLPNVRLKTRN